MNHGVTARVTWAGLLASMPLMLFSGAAAAGNGLNDIGFGTQSTAMGGADLAVTDGTSALNINPAGLTQIRHRAFDADVEPFWYISNSHTDQYDNHQRPTNPVSAVFGGGYAERLGSSNFVAGIGVFAQGGAGYIYDNLNTAFGTQDDVSAVFGLFRIEPGLAWKVNDQLSLGAALGLNYAQAREKFFPDTSYAPPGGGPGFDGFRLDGLSGWSGNLKVGLQFQLNPQWMLAAAYTSKTQLKLDGGTLTMDDSSAGLGYVKYRDATLKGLAVAQEAGVGVSYRPTPEWILAFDLSWLDWSGALKSTTLIASNPDNPQAPNRLSLASALDWRDQYVVAVGISYQWDEWTTLRGGYNYGRNPIPNGTLNPVLAVTAQSSYTLGFARKLSSQWDLAGTANYEPTQIESYNNPQLPFGPNARERWQALVGELSISRRW